MKKLLENKGFTLIELIVVIVILAVLIMIAVPSVNGYIRISRINTANLNIHGIVEAMSRDYTIKGSIQVLAPTDTPKGVTITLGAQPKYNIELDLTAYNLLISDATVSTVASPNLGNFREIKGVHPTVVDGTKITYTDIDASK